MAARKDVQALKRDNALCTGAYAGPPLLTRHQARLMCGPLPAGIKPGPCELSRMLPGIGLTGVAVSPVVGERVAQSPGRATARKSAD